MGSLLASVLANVILLKFKKGCFNAFHAMWNHKIVLYICR